MTDFDLGEPAPDADEEPDDDQDSSEDKTPPETDRTESDHFENVGPDPSEVDRSDSEDDEDATPDRDPTETGPAFPYDEVKQSPLYAREETWTEFEDKLDMELTPNLREEGIRDDELREIHDIVLEVAIEHLDEFPERLKEKRREA
ncbi:hypothetical protein NP511_22085 (plasmid) [Natrinema thermotolerans]|uniref:Uncharacterized protein n=1 Tax=Natrinema thermotolerans TaxID=121872 RepID=A0AAF0PFJ3_9EURY|nr:hypothetical protein [Natrinema thermotolerans]QCC57133.1 hypothetical protein DVR14_00200 [Natrinema thermotolerans]WMT10287.1 hypothetical protein NP511_22085 [Natrinema thermotolerans]